MKRRFFLLFLSGSFLLSLPLVAYNRKGPISYYDVALDFPSDGGVMLMGSRTWRVAKYVDAGVVAGGGQINRSFDLKTSAGTTLNAETKTFVFPFIGPEMTFHFNWVGLSIGYAGFWSKTDLTVKGDSSGTLTGTTRGWGTGFYSPLLVLDFYDSKHDMVFGFGLGGFLGTSYPELEAQSATARVTTTESPIKTLTFHIHALWAGNRAQRLKERKEKEEDF